MDGRILLLLLISALVISLIVRYRRKPIDEEWRHVPPPNWRCSRGGRDYF